MLSLNKAIFTSIHKFLHLTTKTSYLFLEMISYQYVLSHKQKSCTFFFYTCFVFYLSEFYKCLCVESLGILKIRRASNGNFVQKEGRTKGGEEGIFELPCVPTLGQVQA